MSDGTPHRHVRDSRRDEGSVLVLVLVLMVIGSLVVIPLLQYSMSVTRANSVLSDKTKRIEAVKAGLRVALADPSDLYDVCGAAGPTTAVNLSSTSASGINVSTKCYFVDYEAAQSADELRAGVVATRTAEVVPVNMRGSSWAPVSTDPREWWPMTTTTSTTSKIWLPNLPAHGLNRRAASGHTMPVDAEHPAGWCTVYFPGTYVDPVTITGPVYFASGVYYFEDSITFAGGANAVIGQGANSGCTTDQEAAFYADNAPATHNINGLGATFVFGDTGRFIVDNSANSPVTVLFNARYVDEDDTDMLPSAGVSIMTVNGDLDPASISGDPPNRALLVGTQLTVPGQLEVPLSLVGGGTAPASALTQEYLPSVLTPKPTKPGAPTGVTASARVSGAVVSWTAPSSDGGSPITGYTVSASTGGGCTTNGATTCAISGLAASSVRFTVTATNASGTSRASAASASITPGGTSMTAPGAPTSPLVTPYKGSAAVRFTAPASSGNSVIRGYTVTANPGGAACTVDTTVATPPSPLECLVTGLDPDYVPGYTFTVTAFNVAGTSSASVASAVTPVPATLPEPPSPPTPPVPGPYTPPAVVLFDLPQAAATTVEISGYVAIPQGLFKVVNPNGLSVQLSGGIVASDYDVADARGTTPQSVPMGFIETIVQRKFRIVSTSTAGLETSTAIVQVNQNGAYAINSWEVQ